MAQNLIRVKQIDQIDLSNFIDDVVGSGISVTITGAFSGQSTSTVGESILVSAGLDANPGNLHLKGNLVINYGQPTGKNTFLRYYETGSQYPFIRVNKSKVIIGENIPTSFTPDETLYVKGNVYGSNLVYSTGAQLIKDEKYYEYLTDSSRVLPLLIETTGSLAVQDTLAEFGTGNAFYNISGTYIYNDSLNYYYKNSPPGPFYIYLCDQNKCVTNAYSWVLFTSLSGGKNLYYNSGTSVQTYKNKILPNSNWINPSDSTKITFNYIDLYQFYYSNYLNDKSFIKVKNDRTIDFVRDDGYAAASLSKDEIVLEKVTFGEEVKLTTDSQISFNNLNDITQEYVSLNSNGINLSSLNVNKQAYSYQFNTGNSAISDKYINIFNTFGRTGSLEGITDGKTYLIKNISTGNISITPASIYNSFFTGITGWGNNQYNQINLNSTTGNFIKGYTKNAYSLFIMQNQKITGFGQDNYGETFLGNNLTGVIDLALGDSHALALLNISGRVTGWGNYFYNQVANSAGQPILLTGVTKISAGKNHSLALFNNGTITGWGHNNYGQSVGITGVSGILNNNFGVYTGAWEATPLYGLSGVVDIAAGDNFSLALISGYGLSGFVTGWGQNNYNQTANGLRLSGIIKIAAGGNHALGIRSGNLQVTGWGYNNTGQALSGNNLTGVTQISAGSQHSLALQPYLRNQVTGWGDNSYGQVLTGNFITGVSHISAGGFQSIALFYPKLYQNAYRADQSIPSNSNLVSSEKIENDTSLTLAKNQSVELLGVKNSSYTGWIVLNTNAGVI